MSNTSYIVESGNWKIKVKVEITDEFSYIEAGTRAVEAVFGDKELNENCEMFSLISRDGKDYFSLGNTEENIPAPMFNIFTNVYREKDLNNHDKYNIYLTRKLFENAGQPHNVDLAKQAELMEPEKVKAYVELQKKNKW